MKYPPIAVMSFNRPDYLEQVLASLARQEKSDIENREVFLFQDGAVNAYSGRVYAEAEHIQACVRLFREHFPRGHVLESDTNIGVAENFLRAENLFFQEMKADCAYFFEDDLVLEKRYLRILDQLRAKASETTDVAYFACYGALTAPAAAQSNNPKLIQHIDHLWGFGLHRKNWLSAQPIMKKYYELVVGKDYRMRPTKLILDHFHENGMVPDASSQDNIKYCVMNHLGFVGINTFVAHAKYIGKEGVHFRAKIYEAAGFGRTEILDIDDYTFTFPSDPERAAMRADFTARKKAKRAAMLQAAAAGLASAPTTLRPPRMSPAELLRFNEVLASAGENYAEFGAGGSTLLAARGAFKHVVSVESDPAWAQKVRADPEVAAAIRAGRASILHADIGPVAAWGSPADRSALDRWPRYVGRMWEEWDRRGAFPDLVLVDGRFRVACCISVALAHAARGGGKPPTVLLHDVMPERPGYNRVFDFFTLVEQVETLCVLRPREDVSGAAMLAGMVRHLLDRG